MIDLHFYMKYPSRALDPVTIACSVSVQMARLLLSTRKLCYRKDKRAMRRQK